MSLLLRFLACVSMCICTWVSVLPRAQQHLTAEVRHSYTDATPLCCCLFSPVHWPVLLGRSYACCKIRFESPIMTHGPPVRCILMQDTRLRVCVFVCTARKMCEERGCATRARYTLLQLAGGKGHIIQANWVTYIRAHLTNTCRG